MNNKDDPEEKTLRLVGLLEGTNNKAYLDIINTLSGDKMAVRREILLQRLRGSTESPIQKSRRNVNASIFKQVTEPIYG